MAVPRNRSSNARKNNKRSHHAKKAVNAIPCPNCGTYRIPHHICPSCGTYRSRQFFKQEEE
ncbi:MAG: 50S ribosomal protein L32 [Chlamydiia bacterium]|nr:50S ribosomal protein L32 [Chlamydiia bacterium]